jgi:hypothetical protein
MLTVKGRVDAEFARRIGAAMHQVMVQDSAFELRQQLHQYERVLVAIQERGGEDLATLLDECATGILRAPTPEERCKALDRAERTLRVCRQVREYLAGNLI